MEDIANSVMKKLFSLSRSIDINYQEVGRIS